MLVNIMEIREELPPNLQGRVDAIALDELVELYTERSAYAAGRHTAAAIVGAISARITRSRPAGIAGGLSITGMSVLGSIGKASHDSREVGSELKPEKVINIINRGGYSHGLF